MIDEISQQLNQVLYIGLVALGLRSTSEGNGFVPTHEMGLVFILGLIDMYCRDFMLLPMSMLPL